MYFDSKRSGRKGLPWMDGRSNHEKKSDEYYEKLEDLVEQIDDIESDTPFVTDLEPEDFDSGYQYVAARVRELKKYLKRDRSIDDEDRNDWLDQLADLNDELEDLETDAIVYDDAFDYDGELDWDYSDDRDDN